MVNRDPYLFLLAQGVGRNAAYFMLVARVSTLCLNAAV
ncbi:hypothetical protein PEC302107_04440 [Pectobacterium araliae]|nr:hypothetical protein PEC302107_04440 [Pectobacterium carotovorum subsp. carotovorum]